MSISYFQIERKTKQRPKCQALLSLGGGYMGSHCTTFSTFGNVWHFFIIKLREKRRKIVTTHISI